MNAKLHDGVVSSPVEFLEAEGQRDVNKLRAIYDKFPDHERVHFVEGPKRYVHVNPHAIRTNVQKGVNYPTAIIVDEHGKEHQFHGVMLYGPAGLLFDAKPGLNANVYIETNAKVVALRNKSAPQHHPRGPLEEKVVCRSCSITGFFAGFFSGFARRLGIIARHTPVLSCLMFDPD